jgi:hypothetical protein
MITYEEDVQNENVDFSINSDPDNLLNIKSNLLKPKEKLKIGNRLLEDSKFKKKAKNSI